MKIQDAYSCWSASYDSDRNLTRDLDQAVTREVLAARRCGAILEIGCGTGKNTSLLAGLGERVLALDFSPGMLAQARRKVRSGNVSFAVADLTRPWPCRARSVDLIACNLVLEHIADLRPVFAQARRVLTAAGRFFVCELHPFRQYQGKKARFERGEETIEIAAFVHHLSDFTAAAQRSGLVLVDLREWWHEADQHKPPRLVSFTFAPHGDDPIRLPETSPPSRSSR